MRKTTSTMVYQKHRGGKNLNESIININKDNMENRELAEFEEKYENELDESIKNINFLIENLLKRDDITVTICNDIDTSEYTMRFQKEHTTFSIEITKYQIEIRCECFSSNSKTNDFYSDIRINDNNTYIRWHKELETYYFNSLKDKSNRIFKEICKATKLNRKNTLSKLLDN